MRRQIKGVNLGGWLLMEGYILHGRNIAENSFKEAFAAVNGIAALDDFEDVYRDTFITSQDFKNIASFGATTVRLPFNGRLIEPMPGKIDPRGVQRLVTALDAAHKHKLGVILDLHAAPGAQNADWHGDSTGRALLWTDKSFYRRTCAIWEAVADAAKKHPALVGYDVLNEPVVDENRVGVVHALYKDIISTIRSADRTSTIFLEGNRWAQQIDFLADLFDEHTTVSVHAYRPLDYTFNFVPFLKYPGTLDGEKWNKGQIEKYLLPYAEFGRRHGVRVFVGEFGINWRGGSFGEARYLDDILSVFDSYDFDYTYWTYKAVSNAVFPDGLYQYLPNGPAVRREGPVYGFENYAALWNTDRQSVVDVLATENYTANSKLISVLSSHFKR